MKAGCLTLKLWINFVEGWMTNLKMRINFDFDEGWITNLKMRINLMKAGCLA